MPALQPGRGRRRLALSGTPFRVNRAMGVARRTEAGERELDDGLVFLRCEPAKLAAAYPQQAERLRIPGSVEAIDERLAAKLRER